MAFNAVVVVGVVEVAAVGAEGLAIALGGLLQVLVALQAGRVIDEFLTALPNTVPVDLVGLLEQLHGGIDDTVLRLDDEVMQGIVMRQVAVIAGSAEAGGVVAAVDILAIGRRDRCVGVTAGAELVVASGVEGSVHHCPAGDHADAKASENESNP